ncbi:MAG: phenylalanine--tRNA ligase subunit beta [Bacteroidetes bacterium]|nr:phenylalanine--tRNA ligase subunit beta [Bacteroidota bacterium]
MKISYNWLKTLINTELKPEDISRLLTDCGLEVESMEAFESVKGGLKGVVVGEVVEREKHPDADRLSLTKVNVGGENLLSIVCGAPNVAAGQKVLVATVGCTLFPSEGDPIEIKKSKIRGAVSEGMICAEDEIGVGKSHDGILVLPADTKVGMPAADYFKLENDVVFEIGLTPNRSDAASHLGVARDLAAVLKTIDSNSSAEAKIIGIRELPPATGLNTVEIKIENTNACKRYSGLVVSGITVASSPDWLQNRLKAIGLRPINNVVDITNFVLHELGQPLHAFDLEKIKGNKVIVKTCAEGTKFKTLDEVERKLSANDLMICNESEPMCIAGVFGGIDSGVTESTKAVFLESAYFDSAYIRKTGKHHGLKTDASFRFERGTDPEMTVTALKRAANLIMEICGGTLSMDVVDVYPEKLEPYKVAFSYKNCHDLIGKNIDKSVIKNIITALGIEITSEGTDGLLLNVPRFKTDVTREADVIEEVMRVYGYNNVEISNQISFGVQQNVFTSANELENKIADLLIGYGFNEVMSLSLTKEALYQDNASLVKVVNPLSQDLNVLRGNMLYSGLEAIAYNTNRKSSDIKFYEIGKTYAYNGEAEFKYAEQKHLSLFVSGKKINENPYQKAADVDFAYIKACAEYVLKKLGITNYAVSEGDNSTMAYSMVYTAKKKVLVEIGAVAKSELKKFDLNQAVFYADFNLDVLFELNRKNKTEYAEIPKFPAVRRDLAMLLDKSVKYTQIEELAYTAERKFLKEVNLFDIYEGEKIGADKKSYAVSFTLLNEESTLTDKQIEGIMQKLITTYKEKLNAKLR